ncbi:MAG: biotin synthase BioB [Deltaproteobacteria bacterium]|nr:biotin synthase BioB [Deltaproteobacteria bacterium]
MLFTSARFIQTLTEKAITGQPATRDEAGRILAIAEQADIMLLLAHANLVRQHFHGDAIDLCAIVNAKSGRCSEDCAFCAQSAHFKTAVQEYPLLSTEKISAAAKNSLHNSTHRFSIVTSGRGVSAAEDFESICATVGQLAAMPAMAPCASLGILSGEQFARLKQAGLKRYHHNLETAESFYGSICTTHSFGQRAATVRAAREAGLEVCCGGILGLGETPTQRVELALALQELDVDSVPLNFLNPIAGTRLEHQPLLPPLEILKAIAMFRFVLPKKEIRVCGGRETNLRTLQPLMYLAGANGAMTGNYLTTAGRDPAADVREILDLGLAPHLPERK